MAAKLLGRTQPRLWTPPLRKLTRATSHGYAIADFADVIGEPFLPWQRWLAIHAMELNPDGSYRFRVVLVLVARQNGKSSVKRTISLWRLHVDGVRLILGVAQDLGLAREQWQMCLDTIYGCPDLAADLDQVRRVNGDEWLKLKTELDARGEDLDDRELLYEDDDWDESLTLDGGGRYKIAASNRRAGRGLSVDELNIDELREQRNWNAWSALYFTTMARPNAQIWGMSNQSDDDAVVLQMLRDSALAGRDPAIGLFEWSAPDGCELDDPRAWAHANPGLGRTINEAAIRTALATSTPAVFRTEVLCQKVDQLDGAIDYAAWKALADPLGNMNKLRDRVAVCFDVAPDGQHVTLLACGVLDDGRPRLEIVRDWPSTAAARAELEPLLERVQPKAFGWFPGGPSAELATFLRPIAVRWNKRPGKRRDDEFPEDGEIKGAAVSQVCMELAGLVRARGLVHAGQELLDAHIRGASKLATGDGWRFTRRGDGHCDAAYSAAGAVNAALTMPQPRRHRLRMIVALVCAAAFRLGRCVRGPELCHLVRAGAGPRARPALDGPLLELLEQLQQQRRRLADHHAALARDHLVDRLRDRARERDHRGVRGRAAERLDRPVDRREDGYRHRRFGRVRHRREGHGHHGAITQRAPPLPRGSW